MISKISFTFQFCDLMTYFKKSSHESIFQGQQTIAQRPKLVFVNKILLEQSHSLVYILSMATSLLQQQS